ncbi:MAG: cobalamin-binding protein [Candidatus Omnitrophica bacterium]|nr:cobalamin-binding protein [Candidatus Omnitrophota bacterium]
MIEKIKKLLTTAYPLFLLTGITLLCISPTPITAEHSTMRIISLAPSTTEILFALGLDKEIVGVSTYCNYPPEVKNKTRIGDFSHPNLEKIAFLKPDYIFCTGLEQTAVIAELKRLKFNVYVADPANIEGLLTSIEDIGRITHKESQAEELIKKMRQTITRIKSQVNQIPQGSRVRVFIEIWHEPLMTAGYGSFVDELITTAGGINIAHDVKRPYSNFSAERVIKLNPGCIIVTYMDKQAPLKLIAERFGWRNIDAVKNKRCFNDIDPDILLRPGPRITEGLEQIYKKLYP